MPDLGDGLREPDRGRASRAGVISTIPVPPGPWSLDAQGPVGFLVTEGAIVRDVLLAGVVASDLLGPGDVAALTNDDDALIQTDVRLTVSAPTRVAMLDEHLLGALEAWPAIVARLLARATRQTSTMALQRAISQLPRVDQRLLALFWHLAERWGRVGRDGIVVRLALTHETLGRMVGARRPTVSLALKELATDGIVVRQLDGSWVLRRDGVDRLALDAGNGGWQSSDATVLPDLSLTKPAPLQVLADVRVAELRTRLAGLDDSYAEKERRVREVLERCAATREELTRSRERRAGRSSR